MYESTEGKTKNFSDALNKRQAQIFSRLFYLASVAKPMNVRQQRYSKENAEKLAVLKTCFIGKIQNLSGRLKHNSRIQLFLAIHNYIKQIKWEIKQNI